MLDILFAVAASLPKVRVCGREDAYIRWPYVYDRLDLFKPFVVARALGAFDVSIDVRGGGPTGQAMAARLAIGRALVEACPDCREDLEKGRGYRWGCNRD